MVAAPSAMTTATAVSESPPVTKAALRDFSDWLSPMLVKELRQGLKSPVFTWGLIAMQMALAIMALVAMDSGNDRDANRFFWWSVAGVVCVLLPMRVANALRDEMGGNTLDTLVLTRLSAWRITLGKWLATSALQLLVAMTVLPYLIMRYFAGGVNMPMELAWLGIYVVFGLLVTAVMLGLSWFRYFLVRAVLMLGVIFGAMGFCGGTISVISRANDYGLDVFYRELGWPGIICLLTGVVWVAFFFLDLGAAQIAPRAENRATRRRLVALAVFVTVSICCFCFKDREGGVVISMMLLVAMTLPCIQALCELPANYAPVLQPFVKRGMAGRLAGRFLYPGWHTGLCFCLLVAVTGITLFTWHYYQMRVRWGSTGLYDRMEYFLTLMLSASAGVVGAMILPLVIWRLFRRMEQWNFWRWMTVLLAAVVFHMLVMIAAWRMESPGLNRVNHALPTAGLLVDAEADMEASSQWRARNEQRNQYNYWEDRQREEHQIAQVLCIVSLCSLAVWLGAALWLAAKEMRLTRSAETELAAELKRARET